MVPPEYTTPAERAQASNEWALVESLRRLRRSSEPRVVRTRQVAVQLQVGQERTVFTVDGEGYQ